MIKTNKKLQGRYSRRVLQKRVVDSTDKTLLWDPSESVATRPLMFKLIPQGLNLFYVFDGNKNVSDVFYFSLTNGVGAHYDYAPFGAITRTSKSTSVPVDIINENPIRFSSEFHDSELGLIYYNYRHYSPLDGRFLSRDPIEEQGGLNLYAFLKNNLLTRLDFIGTFDVTIPLNLIFFSTAFNINYEIASSSKAGVTLNECPEISLNDMAPFIETSTFNYGVKLVSGVKGSKSSILSQISIGIESRGGSFWNKILDDRIAINMAININLGLQKARWNVLEKRCFCDSVEIIGGGGLDIWINHGRIMLVGVAALSVYGLIALGSVLGPVLASLGAVATNSLA